MVDGSTTPNILDATIDALRAACGDERLLYHEISLDDVDNEHGIQDLLSTLDRDQQRLSFPLTEFGESSCRFITDIYAGHSQALDDGSKRAVLPVRNEDGLLGLLVTSVPLEKDEISSLFRRFLPAIVNAQNCNRIAEQKRLHESFQASIVKLARFAEGDLPSEELRDLQGELSPIGASAVFTLGADLVAKVFAPRAHTCVIFDATDIRYIVRDDDGTTSNNSSSGATLDSGAPKKIDALTISKADSSAIGDVVDDDHRTIGEDHRLAYLASTKDMTGELIGSPPATGSIEQRTSFPNLRTSSSTRSDKQMASQTSHSRSNTSNEISIAEQFLQSNQDRVLCSYARSSSPVSILAISSDGYLSSDLIDALDGDIVRQSMAGHFASARTLDQSTHLFVGDGKDSLSAMPIMELLNKSERTEGFICVPCVDANLQPSFWMLIVFDRKPVLDHTKNLFVEQIGITLSNALLQKRSKAVDYAQQRFIQKVQHELRTPLHAILGVNETIRYTLQSTTRRRQFLQRKASEASKDSSNEPEQRSGHDDNALIGVLKELSGLNNDINGSADQLSALIDDLVDFRFLQQTSNNQPKKVGQHDADNEGGMPSPPLHTSSPPVSFATLMSVLNTTVERAWSLFRKTGEIGTDNDDLPPPPELVMRFQDDSETDSDGACIELDLDCLRRIVWKLVTNAVRFTDEGLITIEVLFRSIVVEKDVRQEKELEHSEKISQDRYAHSLLFTIKDTGCGMSREFLKDRVFQAYQQEDPDNAGVGLSLTLCRYLIDQMGGWIKADSVEGKGSIFTFSIPVKEKKGRRKKAEQPTKDRPDYEGDFDGVLLGFCGFEKRESLRLLQNAVSARLKGIKADVSSSRTDEFEVVRSADVVLIAPDYVHQNRALMEKIENALEGRRDLPELIISMAQTLQHKFLPKTWDKVVAIYERRNESSKIHEILRPFFESHLARLQGVCDKSRQKRKPDFQRKLDEKSSEQSSSSSLSSAASISGESLAIKNEREKGRSENSLESSQMISAYNPSDVVQEKNAGFKVLVVEDNALNAKIVTTLLRRARLDYCTAVDGVEAVQKFKEELPAVVLLDINMPRMDGFEAARQMRAVRTSLSHYIVAITALSSEHDRLRGLEAGMDDWFTKPLRLGPLIDDLQARKQAFDVKELSP